MRDTAFHVDAADALELYYDMLDHRPGRLRYQMVAVAAGYSIDIPTAVVVQLTSDNARIVCNVAHLTKLANRREMRSGFDSGRIALDLARKGWVAKHGEALYILQRQNMTFGEIIHKIEHGLRRLTFDAEY